MKYMSSPHKAHVITQKLKDLTKVVVTGYIGEDTQFNAYFFDGKTSVEMDLSQVKGINSIGIVEWKKWMNTVGEAPITFVNCPKFFIDRVNMVENFLPTQAVIVSFYVPYYSEDSGEEKFILFRDGIEFKGRDMRVPLEVRDSQGQVMEMDVVESIYFKFLRKRAA